VEFFLFLVLSVLQQVLLVRLDREGSCLGEGLCGIVVKLGNSQVVQGLELVVAIGILEGKGEGLEHRWEQNQELVLV